MNDTLPLFAVDGGGTGCRAALVWRGQRMEVTGGPANASTDFPGTVAALRTLLGELAAQAGLGWADLARGRGYLGLAGIMSAAEGAALAAALGLTQATVADDQASTVVGALGGGDGTVCAIGTGSFLGRQSGGAIRRIGGWGFHLGDQASGAWLGRRLLQEALLARDGLRAATPLLTATFARDYGDGGLPAFQHRARPADFARLAPQVTAADDPAARALMEEGAAYLRAGLEALGWRRGETLCLTGGVGPFYAPLLGHPVTAPRGTALNGALILAGRA
jgi:glucosamine kinase